MINVLLGNVKVDIILSFSEKGKLHIVMQCCNRGDLSKFIREQKATQVYFPEFTVTSCFIQVALAVKYLHERNIIHRDIKPLVSYFHTVHGLSTGFLTGRTRFRSPVGAQ